MFEVSGSAPSAKRARVDEPETSASPGDQGREKASSSDAIAVGQGFLKTSSSCEPALQVPRGDSNYQKPSPIGQAIDPSATCSADVARNDGEHAEVLRRVLTKPKPETEEQNQEGKVADLNPPASSLSALGEAGAKPCAVEKPPEAKTGTVGTAPGKAVQVRLEAAVSEDKGSRHTMEDAWVIMPDARGERGGKMRCAYYAVFDGHGGRRAAEYARKRLHLAVLAAGLPCESVSVKGAKKAILEGIKKTDEALLRQSAEEKWNDGATAVCAWVLGQTVFVANLGDAKGVLARSCASDEGSDGRGATQAQAQARAPAEALPLKGLVVTRDHIAIYPQERARIEKAGGVIENGRVLGRLQVSRALGDAPFKKVGVSAVADISVFEITAREQFLILACDGLWGVMAPSDAVQFVAGQLKQGAGAEVACRRLVREAVRERGCKDNCTALLVLFARPQA
eukprot:jgi/Mesen1/3822/ME000207S02833